MPEKFDFLALDCFQRRFASHAPVDAREALRRYPQRLAPGGLIAIHVTHSFIHSCAGGAGGGVGRQARSLAVRVYDKGDDDLASRSDWMLLGRETGAWRDLAAPPPPPRRDDLRVRLWTDQYSNLFEILGVE